MCCCQLVSAVAHLPPVLANSCLCFVAPKQGPDSGPKIGAASGSVQNPAAQRHPQHHGIPQHHGTTFVEMFINQ